METNRFVYGVSLSDRTPDLHGIFHIFCFFIVLYLMISGLFSVVSLLMIISTAYDILATIYNRKLHLFVIFFIHFEHKLQAIDSRFTVSTICCVLDLHKW